MPSKVVSAPVAFVLAVSGLLAGAALGYTTLPPVVNKITAADFATLKKGSLVDFGPQRVTQIRAWTNGLGSTVNFGNLICLYSPTGDIAYDLLDIGDTVNLQGRMFNEGNKDKSLRISLLDCTVSSTNSGNGQ